MNKLPSFIKNIGISGRIIALSLTVVIAVVAVNYYVFIKNYSAAMQASMIEKAAAFTSVAEKTQAHTSTLEQENAFDTETLVKDLAEQRAKGVPVSETRIFKTLPIVAGWTAAGNAAKAEGIDFYVKAFDARNKNNQPEPGTFEHGLLKDLKTQDTGGGDNFLTRIDKATNSLHYMRSIHLSGDCLSCHGNPTNSPTGDGLDIVGYPMENWETGDMHGAYHVVMPLSPLAAQQASFITKGLMWTLPCIALGVFALILLMRMFFGKPVHALIERIRDIAEGEGDLTLRVDASKQDELGHLSRWFNTFLDKVHDIIAEVASSTQEVASAATQIASSSETMAAGMDEQSGQIQNITAAMSQMSQTVDEVANQSVNAATAADESGRLASEGGGVVRETVDGMQAIRQAVETSAHSVKELGRRGEEIGQIIGVINDIADQTNLLALNAAIEAARAGEHGRGFAVVADEVRKLADRTTTATDEIAGSIRAIQDETTQAVQRMDEGAQSVQYGVEQANQAGDSLQQIVGSAQSVAEMIQSIATAAEEQSSASTEVANNVSQIADVTSQTTESTRQAAVAANQLSDQSEKLLRLVSRFKTKGH